MNLDQIAGKWDQIKGQAQQQWGELTNDDWDKVEGNGTELVGLIQERYGKSKEEAEKEVDAWLAKH